MKHGRDTALGVSLRGLNDKWVYLITAVSAVSRRKKEEGSRKKEEGRRKNAHTASFLATCILRLIKWIYLQQAF
ncbi:MAG: hypothetical protein WBL95_09645 [Microcoleus sp.]